MNSQNRFYKVLDALFDENMYESDINLKKDKLLSLGIGLYDVIEYCSIEGSNDSSIKNVICVDLVNLLKNNNIKHIFLNGRKANEIFLKYHSSLKDISTYLPSTSGANAKYSLEKLIEEWRIIKNYL